MKLIIILLLGIGILAGALVLNLVSSWLGFANWYEYLKDPQNTTTSSYMWLFLVYPFGLGLIAFFAGKVLGLH